MIDEQKFTARNIVLLIVGLLLLGVAFDYSKRVGAGLLAIIVLGLLYNARARMPE